MSLYTLRGLISCYVRITVSLKKIIGNLQVFAVVYSEVYSAWVLGRIT